MAEDRPITPVTPVNSQSILPGEPSQAESSVPLPSEVTRQIFSRSERAGAIRATAQPRCAVCTRPLKCEEGRWVCQSDACREE